MAKVIFIQRLWYEYLGTALLCAVLKRAGHQASVLIGEKPRELAKGADGADLVGFSLMTGMQDWALRVAEEVKAAGRAMVIFGGPHPTYYPEVILEKGVDLICMGEGEQALVELADKIDSGSDLSGIENLWVKENDRVYKNPLRPMVQDLDALPFADREAYYERYSYLRQTPNKPFMAGRGCPYKCSFCFNESLKEMYRGKGRFVRFRSPQNLIDEIKQVRAGYPLKTIFFHDDILILNKRWLKEFLPLYRKEVSMPFYAAARADTLCEEIAALLAEAGCKCVSFAIESGDEKVRNELLQKMISDGRIVEAAAILKRHGVKLTTFNMVGLPGETAQDALKTVELNMRIRADYPRCSFLTPYPGTKIAKWVLESGYIESSIADIRASSQQSGPTMVTRDRAKIINIHSFFQTAVLFPRLYPLLKLLINLPPNKLFRAWWALVYFWVFVRGEGRGVRDMAIFAKRAARSLLGK